MDPNKVNINIQYNSSRDVKNCYENGIINYAIRKTLENKKNNNK